MMILVNEALLEKTMKLNRAIAEDKRVVLLNRCEHDMENDADVMRLTYLKDVAETTYNDAIRHYGNEAIETKKAQKDLFIAKSELDKHPLVKAYLVAYQAVRRLYNEINEQLFMPFKEHFCEDKKS